MKLLRSNHMMYIHNWLLVAVTPIQDGRHSQMTLENPQMAITEFYKNWTKIRCGSGVIYNTYSC